MKNTDRVIDYLLENATKLTANKIEAFAKVVHSLGGEVELVPNEVKDDGADPNLVDEDAPIDLSKVTKIKVDGREQPIKVYKN